MARKGILGQLSDIDIRLLRVFRTVTESGGISAAELELNIGRSTISRHIKDLEIRLGVTLCQRGRSGFSLSEEGAQIYNATLRMLASLDDFRDEVNGVHQRLAGSISIGMLDKTVSNPNSCVSAAIALFDDVAPDVSLEMYVQPLNEIERGVIEGRFQVGIVPGHRTSSSLDYVPLFEEQMYLYCGQQHPLFVQDDADISHEDIRKAKYAGMGYHSPNMEVGHKLDMNRIATVYDQEAIATLMMSGRYLGYLPDHYARQFVEQGQIRALAVDEFNYQCQFLSIVRHAPKPSLIAMTFLDCLKKAHAVI